MFVLNAVDGCIPSDLGAGTTAEMEEERRLLYVAMTAPRMICIWSCHSVFLRTASTRSGDRHVYASKTRFISIACPDCSREPLGHWWYPKQRPASEQGATHRRWRSHARDVALKG